eukprot:998181-Rhodomonas_salina.1
MRSVGARLRVRYCAAVSESEEADGTAARRQRGGGDLGRASASDADAGRRKMAQEERKGGARARMAERLGPLPATHTPPSLPHTHTHSAFSTTPAICRGSSLTLTWRARASGRSSRGHQRLQVPSDPTRALCATSGADMRCAAARLGLLSTLQGHHPQKIRSRLRFDAADAAGNVRRGVTRGVAVARRKLDVAPRRGLGISKPGRLEVELETRMSCGVSGLGDGRH